MPLDSGRRTGSTLMVWTGGAVFVASLFWFVYSYLVRFGPAAPGEPAARPITLNVAMFSIFALHHSVFARPRAKEWVRALAGPELERSVYTWVASLMFLALCTWWQPVPGLLYSLHGTATALPYAAQAVAIWLIARGSAALDVLDLAGIRPLLLAKAGVPPRHVALETRGVYGFVRHPVYFAWAVFVCATPEMSATRLVFALVSTGYLPIAIPWEERSLMRIFGDEYEAYRRRVKWRMVPLIY